MVKTQIQLPNELYDEVKRITTDQEWSIDEVLCRGAEVVDRTYPSHKKDVASWKIPTLKIRESLFEDTSLII